MVRDPLWTTTYSPDLNDLPQETLQETLSNLSDGPINIMLYGPRGSGKTATARALGRTLHDDPDNDYIEVNVADFFDRTKKEIANDDRFESFITSYSDYSKTGLIKHVLKELVSYQPVSGSYKTVLLDNSERMRADFQQSLRRLMERHHESTQFIIATRNPTSIIPPLQSRCFPLPVHSPSEEDITEVLTDIAEHENVGYTEDSLDYITAHVDGNLRKAILILQAAVENPEVDLDDGVVTMGVAYDAVNEVGYTNTVELMLDDAENGDFMDARDTLDDLLADEGLEGDTVISLIRDLAKTRYRGEKYARVMQVLGEVDYNMTTGTNERLHLSNLLAKLGTL